MHIPSARLMIQQASPANVRTKAQYESTKPVQKPRNRFPMLKQALIAHMKAHPDQLLKYTEKDAAAFQKKFPEVFPDQQPLQPKHWN